MPIEEDDFEEGYPEQPVDEDQAEAAANAIDSLRNELQAAADEEADEADDEPAEEEDAYDVEDEPGEPVPPGDINKLWDDMLRTVTAATRNAVWETGIESISALLATDPAKLIKPHGPLTADNVKDIEVWAARYGLCFKPAVAVVDTTRAARSAQIRKRLRFA